MIKRSIPYYKKEWLQSLNQCIEQYDFSPHSIVEELENKIKAYVGRKYAVAVNSGTNAIFMCLHLIACENAEVIIPNWGYPSIANICKALNLKAVPVDLKENTLSMDPNIIKTKITKNTIAIVNTGNNGIIGTDIEVIKNIAKENNLMFIEDCAPSLLQKYNGTNAGCFGDVSMFSFSPTKPVICGEGAILLTDDHELYKKLKILRHMTYSSDKKNFKCFAEDSNEGSLNFSLSPFLAAYIIPQLDIDNLNEVILKRERVHALYKQRLNVFGETGVTNRYGYVMYLSNKASDISKKLNLFKIEHRYKYYPLYNDINFPVSKMVFESIIDLPSNYFLTEDQINAVCKIISSTETNA